MYKFSIYINILLLFLFSKSMLAQSDTAKALTFNAFGEFYYSYDFSNPSNREKPNFIYNHKRSNELNLNLLLIDAKFTSENTRANLSLMAGNYAQYNLSSEPQWARYIYQSNVGTKLTKKQNLWLDVGIFPSHIGYESAKSIDCMTLTRSIVAENSPYYETGLNLNYTSLSKKTYVSFLLLNGWQRISIPIQKTTPSIGFQFKHNFNKNIILNYSNYFGKNDRNNISSIRTYHDLFMELKANKYSFLFGFDIGTDKIDISTYGTWYSPVLIGKYQLNHKLASALRIEYFYDKHQIIINTNSKNGFRTYGFSGNIDYKLNKHIQYRLEGKMYVAKDHIFKDNKAQNYSITSNLTFGL